MSSAMARAGQNLASGSAHWKSDGIGTETLAATASVVGFGVAEVEVVVVVVVARLNKSSISVESPFFFGSESRNPLYASVR